MKKIYYNNNSKIICERYPSNVLIDDNCSCIEVEDDVFEKTLIVPCGKVWKVIDSVPVCADDERMMNSKEYKIEVRQNELFALKKFLSDTDYIITKIQEAQIESDENAIQLKEKYSKELSQRILFRKRINELENEIIELKKED